MEKPTVSLQIGDTFYSTRLHRGEQRSQAVARLEREAARHQERVRAMLQRSVQHYAAQTVSVPPVT